MTQQNSQDEIDFFNAIKNNVYDRVEVLAANSPALLDAYDYSCFGATPLTLCASGDNRKMIQLLLDLGADSDRKSDWWAGGWNPIQTALNCGQEDLAHFFHQKGASIGIHEAAGLNLIGELKSILASSPESVDLRGGDGCTALHFAGSAEVVDLLLSSGADINARDIDHYSTAAQYLAALRPNVVRHLYDNGAETDIFTTVMIGDEVRFIEMIQSNPDLLHLKINQETFPPGPKNDVHNILTFIVGMNSNLLHTAAIGKQLRMIEVITGAGIDINSTGGYDESTALHMVAWRDELEVAQKLVACGADIDIRSGEIHNNTPAGWAIVGGSPKVFCYLVDQGATIQDYFEDDIRAGLAGEFMKYKKVPLSNFETMLEIIIFRN